MDTRAFEAKTTTPNSGVNTLDLNGKTDTSSLQDTPSYPADIDATVKEELADLIPRFDHIERLTHEWWQTGKDAKTVNSVYGEAASQMFALGKEIADRGKLKGVADYFRAAISCYTRALKMTPPPPYPKIPNIEIYLDSAVTEYAKICILQKMPSTLFPVDLLKPSETKELPATDHFSIEHAPLFHTLANDLILLKLNTRALVCINISIKLNPTETKAHVCRIELLISMECMAEANKKLIEISPRLDPEQQYSLTKKSELSALMMKLRERKLALNLNIIDAAIIAANLGKFHENLWNRYGKKEELSNAIAQYQASAMKYFHHGKIAESLQLSRKIKKLGALLPPEPPSLLPQTVTLSPVAAPKVLPTEIKNKEDVKILTTAHENGDIQATFLLIQAQHNGIKSPSGRDLVSQKDASRYLRSLRKEAANSNALAKKLLGTLSTLPPAEPVLAVHLTSPAPTPSEPEPIAAHLTPPPPTASTLIRPSASLIAEPLPFADSLPKTRAIADLTVDFFTYTDLKKTHIKLNRKLFDIKFKIDWLTREFEKYKADIPSLISPMTDALNKEFSDLKQSLNVALGSIASDNLNRLNKKLMALDEHIEASQTNQSRSIGTALNKKARSETPAHPIIKRPAAETSPPVAPVESKKPAAITTKPIKSHKTSMGKLRNLLNILILDSTKENLSTADNNDFRKAFLFIIGSFMEISKDSFNDFFDPEIADTIRLRIFKDRTFYDSINGRPLEEIRDLALQLSIYFNKLNLKGESDTESALPVVESKLFDEIRGATPFDYSLGKCDATIAQLKKEVATCGNIADAPLVKRVALAYTLARLRLYRNSQSSEPAIRAGHAFAHAEDFHRIFNTHMDDLNQYILECRSLDSKATQAPFWKSAHHSAVTVPAKRSSHNSRP